MNNPLFLGGLIMLLKIFSKIVFLIMGLFHFSFNYLIFMWNWIQGKNIWMYNNNTIGEANLEAALMTLLMPFFIYGAYLYIKVLLIKQQKLKEEYMPI